MNCLFSRVFSSSCKAIQFSLVGRSQCNFLRNPLKDLPNKRLAHSGLYNVDTGKTIRILQDQVPLLPQKALPDEILSQNIELTLFPYHLHLPKIQSLVIYKFVFKTARILLASAYINGIKNPIDIESQIHTPLSPKTTRYTMKCHWTASQTDEYDCIFHFDINSKGLIYRHIIENLERKKAGQIERIPALEPSTFE
ncbi:hypothetical protein SPOG_05351 [Schizosaccharomyces cryophilus OY26]|uniref:Uncharacterized protein n=1 Tax=Schizosaccharomyces cryophilus (strain OY26 / ATCC MYA-4695 / CBS 11777 / NBRC 106824 / NRRL Y48691) TaxID=653667 RepID=S9VYD7_SCHCR|nr:uncharacterized protein SPOG_05351 [Schizosaccharomyces cryophilus OY26]EPY51279.1 hypothetical protein SPOG_05351 [Schizosaccharomyces cryophilus OY26]